MNNEITNNKLKRSHRKRVKIHTIDSDLTLVYLYDDKGYIESITGGLGDYTHIKFNHTYIQIGDKELQSYVKETHLHIDGRGPKVFEYWWEYDKEGRITSYRTTNSMYDMKQREEYYIYDKYGRVINESTIVTDKNDNRILWSSESSEYDSDSNLIRSIQCNNINISHMIDQNIYTKTNEYDDRNNLISTVCGFDDGGKVSYMYKYDERNNKIYEGSSIYNPRTTYTYEYDKNDNRISFSNELELLASYEYDNDNNRIYTKTYSILKPGEIEREEWIEYLG